MVLTNSYDNIINFCCYRFDNLRNTRNFAIGHISSGRSNMRFSSTFADCVVQDVGWLFKINIKIVFAFWNTKGHKKVKIGRQGSNPDSVFGLR